LQASIQSTTTPEFVIWLFGLEGGTE
jgi:hypothetical protein